MGVAPSTRSWPTYQEAVAPQGWAGTQHWKADQLYVVLEYRNPEVSRRLFHSNPQDLSLPAFAPHPFDNGP